MGERQDGPVRARRAAGPPRDSGFAGRVAPPAGGPSGPAAGGRPPGRPRPARAGADVMGDPLPSPEKAGCAPCGRLQLAGGSRDQPAWGPCSFYATAWPAPISAGRLLSPPRFAAGARLRPQAPRRQMRSCLTGPCAADDHEPAAAGRCRPRYCWSGRVRPGTCSRCAGRATAATHTRLPTHVHPQQPPLSDGCLACRRPLPLLLRACQVRCPACL